MLIRLARPDDVRGLARVHVDAWKSAYAHILPIAELEVQGNRLLSYELREEMWQGILAGEHKNFVAVEEGEILGFASGAHNRASELPTDGELLAIYVHPTAFRRGIGKALLEVVVNSMIAEGFTSMIVRLFRDNHQATEFYKAFGAEFLEEGEYGVGGINYPDSTYRWPSLLDLKSRLSKQTIG